MMKKILVLAALACAVCLAAGSRKYSSKAVYRKISPEKARLMMNKDHILLDVRTKREFTAKHMPGALLIPGNTLKARAPGDLPDKNAVILVYCRSGNRSKTAADLLVSMGYTQVYDMGGIQSWPFETVSEAE